MHGRKSGLGLMSFPVLAQDTNVEGMNLSCAVLNVGGRKV